MARRAGRDRARRPARPTARGASARRSAGRARSRWAPRSVSTRDHRRPPPGVGDGAEAGERGPLAQLDARRLHRERVGADVARRVDVRRRSRGSCRRGGRPRRASDRASRRPRPRRASATSRPSACCIATRSRPARSSVLGDREDQVAELAEARIGAVSSRPGWPVEVDRPAAERDGRRRPALGPDDPGGPRASAHPGQAALEDDDAAGAVGLREVPTPSRRSCPRRRRPGRLGRASSSTRIGRRRAASLGCPARC